MAKTEYKYCDANVFLAYFKQEEGRVETVAQFFGEIRQWKNVKIVTSVISIAEVAHTAARHQGAASSGDSVKELDDLWEDTSLVELSEFYDSLARRARRHVREYSRLKPADAIHLATAQLVGVSEFFTYDGLLLRLSDKFEFEISEPYQAGLLGLAR
ncbi:MAG: PIN domain-containing protein [Anaerolineaceae bacterium]|nr:PIN domain-containing protein [Anaerolineaceae bacterium]